MSTDEALASLSVDLLAERFGTKTRYKDDDAATEIQAASGVEAIGA